MSDVVNPTNYKNMIDALDAFVTKVNSICDELTSDATSTLTVLNDNDIVRPYITGGTSQIVEKYKEHAQEARRISKMVAEDLRKALAEQGDLSNLD